MHEKPIAAGKSSFDLIDRDIFVSEIRFPKGSVLLDAACGSGKYALALSARLGEGGLIYAIDLWEEGIRHLKEAIRREGITNIRPAVGDISALTLEENSVDAVLMATVLHDLALAGTAKGALGETARVLRLEGRLHIVEFKKIDGPPGPPQGVRISPEELVKLVGPFGFREERSVETGPSTYLSTFRFSG
jgi:ubiquinone/menaquinone biosynthesis C-methylase UbiE